MGLLDLFRRRYEPSPANVEPGWQGRREWLSWGPPRNVVREGHYQKALLGLCGGICDEGYLIPVEAVLAREPRNRYDHNAITVHVADTQVGYLRRELAAMLAPAADELHCRRWAVCGVLRGGRRDVPVGVHLWLDRRCTPGVAVAFDDGGLEVPWPPDELELERAISRLPAPPSDWLPPGAPRAP